MTRTEAERFVRNTTAANRTQITRRPGVHVLTWHIAPPDDIYDWLDDHGVEPHARELVSYRGWKVAEDRARNSGFRAVMAPVCEIHFDHASDALLCWMAFSEEASQPFEVPALGADTMPERIGEPEPTPAPEAA